MCNQKSMICLLVAVSMLLAGTVWGQSVSGLNDPPEGFEWHRFSEVDVTVLKPKAWYVKKLIGPDTKAFSISKENVEQEGVFSTGLMLNVIPTESAPPGMTASRVAASLLNHFLADIDYDPLSVSRRKPAPGAPHLQSFGLEIRFEPNVHQVHYLLADDDRDLVYWFYFEGPHDQWSTWVETAHVVLDSLVMPAPQ